MPLSVIPMQAPVRYLDGYVMQKAAEEPLRIRVQLYRAMAEVAPTPDRARQLRDLANGLEEIEARHDQLQLDFRARTKS